MVEDSESQFKKICLDTNYKSMEEPKKLLSKSKQPKQKEEIMSDKLKFNSVGQLLIALEEGPLYDEKGLKYTLNKAELCLELNRSSKLVQKECSLSGIWHSSIICGNRKYFTRQEPIPDKSLVWCWYNDGVHRTVKFYDAEHECAFDLNGTRRGYKYDNYQVIEPNEQGVYEEPFAWANEAVEKLND